MIQPLWIRLLLPLVFLFYSHFAFSAACHVDGTCTQVTTGSTVELTKFSTCKSITNTTGTTIMVPHNSSGEWTAFTGGTNITVGACGPDDTPELFNLPYAYDYDGVSTATTVANINVGMTLFFKRLSGSNATLAKNGVSQGTVNATGLGITVVQGDTISLGMNCAVATKFGQFEVRKTNASGAVVQGSVSMDCESTGGVCFPAGTQITMADGSTTSIERVQVGDAVISFDELENKLRINHVAKVFHHEIQTRDMRSLHFVDGSILMSTKEHPYYVSEFKTYKSAEQIAQLLDEGFRVSVQTQNGELLEVAFVTSSKEKILTYNLEVDGLDRASSISWGRSHNYFANGILVHNKCDYC